MALPSSGPLSLLNIQSEFGGTAPMSLGEYYKGGAYVNQYSLAPHVPRSGPIKISDFYGASFYVPQPRSVTLSDGQTFVVPPTIASGITATVLGAPGGNGGNDAQPGYPGYPGHLVTGTFSVSPGGVIQASIGGPGVGGGSGGGAPGGTGGYGGVLGYSGGRGGDSGYPPYSGAGGGGGGASVVTLNGTPVVVAGGGAGGGGGGCFTPGYPSQGYQSNGTVYGGDGQSKGEPDGGGAGAGGGGYYGGVGGVVNGGDVGAFSGSDGADLIPPGGSSRPFGNTSALYNVSYPVWCEFLNTYGVWTNPDGVNPVGSWVSVSYVVAIPATNSYLLRVSGDNHIQVYIYGNLVGSNDDWGSYNDSTVGINAGATTIVVNGLNDGGPAGFAAALYDSSGNMVWNTRSPNNSNESTVTLQGMW